MKQVKEARNIIIYVNITYKENENELIQTLSFSTKRKQDLAFLYDSRFLIKNEIEKLIDSILLDNFLQRTDCPDKIEMKYSKQDHPAPCIKVINTYMPAYLGCLYCSKAEYKDLFIFCPEKNKHYTKPGIKRCPVFRTKEKIIT